tara:strand:+ start:681 stop:971 length:291 start_codon:yes stop_codon:yes gene_type:complete
VPRDRLAKDIAVYYGMISLMDKQIGRILDYLDARALTEKTFVVFTSDHGHFYGQHGLVDDVLTEKLAFENRQTSVPDGPGLGVEVDELKLAKYRVS